jgi:ABC-2 type transport system ATP-binding protein
MVVELTLADANNCVEAKCIEGDDVAAAIQSALAQTAGRRVVSVNTLRPTLEDVFVKLTGLSSDVMLAEKGGKSNAGG